MKRAKRVRFSLSPQESDLPDTVLVDNAGLEEETQPVRVLPDTVPLDNAEVEEETQPAKATSDTVLAANTEIETEIQPTKVTAEALLVANAVLELDPQSTTVTSEPVLVADTAMEVETPITIGEDDDVPWQRMWTSCSSDCLGGFVDTIEDVRRIISTFERKTSFKFNKPRSPVLPIGESNLKEDIVKKEGQLHRRTSNKQPCFVQYFSLINL